MTNIDKLLIELNACDAAQRWARGKDLHTIWTTCPRGDWLLWLAARMIGKPGWHTHPEVVLAACACAETELKYVPTGEDRPRLAIETARKWAHGEATDKEVRRAASAAYAAASAASAASAVSAASAYAAAYAAASAASAAKLANIVRIHLKEPKII